MNKSTTVVKNPAPETAVTISTKSRGLELTSLEDMWRFASYVIKSGLAPKGIDKPEAVVVALQMGFELGLPPMQSLQNIAVINGRPCVWGDAVPGLVEASGKQEYGYPEKTGEKNPDGSYPDSYGYRYITKRFGRKEYSYTFTVADAKKAKLWGKDGPWTFYPDRMLLNRSRTFCDRDVYPDILKGIITDDEAGNIVDAEFTVEDNKSRTEQVAGLINLGKKDDWKTGSPGNKKPEETLEPESDDIDVDTETGEVTEKTKTKKQPPKEKSKPDELEQKGLFTGGPDEQN